VTRLRLLLLLGILGLNAAVFVVFTLPRTLQRQTIDSRAETLRAEVDRARARLAVLEERQAILRDNARDAARFYEQIVKPPADLMLPTIRFVDKAVSDLGLSAEGRAWSQEPIKGLGIVRFGTTMPLSGPYRQIVAFLSRLERAPLFLVVDDVQLRVRADEEGDLAFHLSAYFKDEAGDAHGT
jgi:Tfp pilus assembly protein PilO